MAVVLEPEPSVGWGACWNSHGRLARMSSTFQSDSCVLGLRASKFVCVPFKSRFLVFYSPLALLVLSPAVFQNQLEGSCLSCTDLRARVPIVDSNLSLLREDLQVRDTSFHFVLPTRGMGLD